MMITSEAGPVALFVRPKMIPVTVPETLPSVFVKEKVILSALAGKLWTNTAEMTKAKPSGILRECIKPSKVG
jgi:hypothetical protein